jgi:hypothetical protein
VLCAHYWLCSLLVVSVAVCRFEDVKVLMYQEVRGQGIWANCPVLRGLVGSTAACRVSVR